MASFGLDLWVFMISKIIFLRKKIAKINIIFCKRNIISRGRRGRESKNYQERLRNKNRKKGIN